MRNAFLIAGAALLLAGALVTAGVFTYKDSKEVLRVGDASLTVTEEKRPDRTLGYALMALGGIGLLAGIVRNK
jgi:hypothetical protein